MLERDAPTEANGTAPAMDQGIKGAMTTAEFSRLTARSFGLISIWPQSWCVSIMAKVWLQLTAEESTDAVRIAPNGVIFLPSF